MKWSGGSTCVPAWSLKDTTETFAVSPLLMRRSGSSLSPGSPGQVTMSGRSTSETSWIFISAMGRASGQNSRA